MKNEPRALLDPDRLFASDPAQRKIARRLYEAIEELPIVSPHGHTDAHWFSENAPFADPAHLLIVPDHYLFRMLYSRGIPLERLGIRRNDGGAVEEDPRAIWRTFAQNYHLFRGTPSRLWIDHTLSTVFGIHERLDANNADETYDEIDRCLKTEAFQPRALFERFGIEVLATTESPLDSLEQHRQIRESPWPGRVVTTFRPDPVVDPDFEGFQHGVRELGGLTGEDTESWSGYLRALAARRDFFRALGATATDHGHPSPRTADLDRKSCERLFAAARAGKLNAAQADEFRGQMLTEMARMSLDDGLVMQIHPGSVRNHNRDLFEAFGRDVGADIPARTSYVDALRPLLDRLGNEPRLSIILFTLDESTLTREFAPLAGHYPTLTLGPPWWFLDSPEAMLRFRRATTETAGFQNTAGFNDDTRAFLSIPARHDVARRIDCRYLAELVAEHRLEEDEALEVAADLAYHLVRRAYRLEHETLTS